MREFFMGWRRKAGVVTLMMACAACGLWLRSKTFSDPPLRLPDSLAGPAGNRSRISFRGKTAVFHDMAGIPRFLAIF